MIQDALRAAREFHAEPDGKRWFLARDPKTGQPFVIHHLGKGRLTIELDLGSFLVLFEGREREGLFRLIGSLLPNDGPALQQGGNVVRPSRFLSRGTPAGQR
ncbi:hypothetical protein [Methylobacterium sp. J-070]|uniref:hypothetical protein n=1 Tax=Methylobacterium sp. J-070 TaxID=2836650 RepID=UPI001FBB5C5E|nr:hypothetical protein [Methylobacterium sp. J-070]MCJ2050391.1 hypothetical protein [Methylobacterium sp. J-070]